YTASGPPHRGDASEEEVVGPPDAGGDKAPGFAPPLAPPLSPTFAPVKAPSLLARGSAARSPSQSIQMAAWGSATASSSVAKSARSRIISACRRSPSARLASGQTQRTRRSSVRYLAKRFRTTSL